MTTTDRIDPRITRTKKLLREALIALITERGYDAITVQDITERADVSRTTFYLHYRSKDELLISSFIDLYESLTPNVMVYGRDEFARNVECCDTADFDHVAQHADFYRVMLSERGSMIFLLSVMGYLQTMFTHDTFKSLLPPPEAGEPRLPLNFMAAFMAGAELGVVKWWLDQGMQPPAAEVARMQFELAAYGIAHALRIDEQTEERSDK